MEFALSPEVESLRQLIRKVIAETFRPEMIERQHTTGTFDCPEVNRALAAQGLIERAVPGLGKGDPVELWVFFHELDKAGVPVDALTLSLMVAGIVNRMGTAEQKARILPSIVEARSHVCMGYSEPDYGSDLASITTRAERVGDTWVI